MEDHMSSRSRLVSASLVLALLLVMVMPAIAGAQEASGDESPPPSPGVPAIPSVAPPGSDPLGVAYGDWAADWWSWLLTAPAEASPMLVGGCSARESAPVVFVPQTFFGNALEFECAVSHDRWLLVGGAGVECDSITGGGETEEELSACVEEGRASFSHVSITVDGEPVPALGEHWVTSPMYELEIPEGNLFGLPGGTTNAVAGGWFVMIEPLAPGSHTIVVRGEVDQPEGSEEPLEDPLDEEPLADGPLVAEVIVHLEVSAAPAP
jgi:hypothetical protein